MPNKMLNNFQKKSPLERFLLVISMLVFLGYFTLGLIVIFWRNFPIDIKTSYRIALGVVLIIYSFTRLMRFFNSNKE